MSTAGLEFRGLSSVRSSLAFLESVTTAGFEEQVEIEDHQGRIMLGRVLSTTERGALVEIFAAPQGIQLDTARVRFHGRPLRFAVGAEMLGRVFDGLGHPRDALPQPLALEEREINGSPINPARREYPRDFLETGISAIDCLNTVVLGQKLPIFSEAGLPHEEIAVQIIRQARAPAVEEFAVVFVGLGLPREATLRYQESFRAAGVADRTVAFLNFADEPAAERVMTPRCALTAAEYLAFDAGLHVLVILDDITNYGEALREVSAARNEVPSRKGYPGYLYSDLASIFERAGRVQGKSGSITQIPIVTMPGGDPTHPVPDLTGYVTEGQIVLDRQLMRRGIYPPIAILPSLSRLMVDGIGEGRTRLDHPYVARQLYAAYARVARARSLASIVGVDELNETEKLYLKFGDAFEADFLMQQREESRSIAATLDLAWRTLRLLPAAELTRIPARILDQHP